MADLGAASLRCMRCCGDFRLTGDTPSDGPVWRIAEIPASLRESGSGSLVPSVQALMREVEGLRRAPDSLLSAVGRWPQWAPRPGSRRLSIPGVVDLGQLPALADAGAVHRDAVGERGTHLEQAGQLARVPFSKDAAPRR